MLIIKLLTHTASYRWPYLIRQTSRQHSESHILDLTAGDLVAIPATIDAARASPPPPSNDGKGTGKGGAKGGKGGTKKRKASATTPKPAKKKKESVTSKSKNAGKRGQKRIKKEKYEADSEDNSDGDDVDDDVDDDVNDDVNDVGNDLLDNVDEEAVVKKKITIVAGKKRQLYTEESLDNQQRRTVVIVDKIMDAFSLGLGGRESTKTSTRIKEEESQNIMECCDVISEKLLHRYGVNEDMKMRPGPVIKEALGIIEDADLDKKCNELHSLIDKAYLIIASPSLSGGSCS